MKYDIQIEDLPIGDILSPAYNPRIDVEQGSKEYEEIKRSFEQYGMVEPLVVNRRSMNCVGGNQRLAVLRDMGEETAPCVIVDVEDGQEKKLNLSLNRITGRWDTDLLTDLLNDEDVTAFETGFTEDEAAVYRMLNGKEQEPAKTETVEDTGDDIGEILSAQTVGVTVGAYRTTISMEEYQALTKALWASGIFEKREIVAELKARLTNG